MNKVKLNGITYQGDDLLDLDSFIGDALAAEELAIDTLTAEVQDTSTVPTLLAADGLLASAGGVLLLDHVQTVPLIEQKSRYGDVVEYHRSGRLFGKFYLETILRTGKYAYQLNCVSGIGLLRPSTHYGGLYNGETAGDVIRDIIGGLVEYTLSPALSSVPLFGWLPIASRRDNLRNVLFALGGQIRKDTAGAVQIVPQESGAAYNIDAEALYMGGSVTGLDPATGVTVTEHAYIAFDTDEETTLFDGETAAEEMVTPKGKTVTGVLVEFSEPIHDLQISNAEILESGANYAVLTGSPAALLTGKRYTHTQRIITRKNDNGSTVPTIVTANDCGLVNLMNSELVADRLMAYYGSAREIETEFVVDGQKPGDAVKFPGPFGDEMEGYIGSMGVSGANTLKASAKIISGYIPTASGNYYSHLAVLTGSGSWTVPAECKGKIRVVLIGGGQGGHGGTGGNGSIYQDAVSYSASDQIAMPDNDGIGADGGLPGAPGIGGKVFVYTMTVTAGQVIAYSVGQGGAGGIGGGGGVRVAYDPIYATDKTPALGSSGLPGEDGGDTTFGSLSSANGKVMEVGYIEITGGVIYATPGVEGVAGGKGGGVYGGEKAGESVGEWPGGTPGERLYQYNPSGDVSEPDYNYIAQGGGGGGAAYGCAGYKGGNAAFWSDMSGIQTGAGGNGGWAIQAAAGKVYGAGGQGGHGGGGAGNTGAGYGGTYSVSTSGHNYGKAAGGAGGSGGDGADGVILIYY